MPSARVTGNAILCSLLEELGIRTVFGLPSSESIGLFEELRKSSLRTILAVDERAAAFMANGYYRAAGERAVVVASSGPGFTNTLTGLAEACHDSAALVCIVIGSDYCPERKFRLRVVDQPAMSVPVVKAVFQVDQPADLARTISEAYAVAVSGEPGPVLVETNNGVLAQRARFSRQELQHQAADSTPAEKPIGELADYLGPDRRVVLYAGQGAAGAANEIHRLAELLNCPVLTSGSGRAVIPENHPLSFYYDFSWGSGGETINRLIAQSDVVLALGIKFTHNGTGGFQLKIPADKLVHIDASSEVLGANYPAALTVQGDVPEILRLLVKRLDVKTVRPSAWEKKDLDTLHEQLAVEKTTAAGIEPLPVGGSARDMAAFFQILREALPDNVCLITDCGLHQVLTRNYFEVHTPRGMISPTDYQSMGFGLPAAIGAKLAAPKRPVVAVVGDGGFAMTAMELTTAVREKIPLTVIVFNDGNLGIVRLMQLKHTGHEFAVGVQNPNYEQLARSLGVSYARWDNLTGPGLPDILVGSEVKLLEVPLIDSPAIRKMRMSGRTRNVIRTVLGPQATARLKKWLGR
jgi:acetolactate synthase-1/2/3 large subunit